MASYKCENCKEEWEFIPKDYRYRKSSYPTRCPLCSMSFLDLVKDTYREGGIREVIYWIKKRYL